MDDVFLIRQDVLEGEIPNYLILLPGGGHTLADVKWASRFDSHSAEQALAMVQKAWPMHTFRKVPVEEAPWAGDICVGGDFWIVVDVNGIPSGPAYTEKEESSARRSAERLTKDVPQFAPYTVHRYVSAWRLQSSQEWYAARWERLDQLVREEATEEFKKRWFSTMANGTPGMHDPPTFARLLSTRNHEIHQLMEQRQLTPVQLANAVDQLRGDDASLFARTYAELPARDDVDTDPLYAATSVTPRLEARELRAQLAAITEALGPRVAKDETLAQAVARLVEDCVAIVKRNDEV